MASNRKCRRYHFRSPSDYMFLIRNSALVNSPMILVTHWVGRHSSITKARDVGQLSRVSIARTSFKFQSWL